MEFNCYDVLEVQGSRYVITEKIKYNEIIPKADQEQAYKAKPSMQKSPGDYWHEYGLEAVEGIDKILKRPCTRFFLFLNIPFFHIRIR